MSCEKPPWEQPQPLNVYPVTLGGLTEDPSSCDVPSYEQPQDLNVYPVTQGASTTVGPPTGRFYECIDGQPGTLSAKLSSIPEPKGRLSILSYPIGTIKVLP